MNSKNCWQNRTLTKAAHELRRINHALGRATTLCGMDGIFSQQKGGVLCDNGQLYEVDGNSPTCRACLKHLTDDAHKN